MNKLSSYQKLKKQNAELIQDISALMGRRGSYAKMFALAKWDAKIRLGDAVWFGESNHGKNEIKITSGLVGFIKNKKT